MVPLLLAKLAEASCEPRALFSPSDEPSNAVESGLTARSGSDGARHGCRSLFRLYRDVLSEKPRMERSRAGNRASFCAARNRACFFGDFLCAKESYPPAGAGPGNLRSRHALATHRSTRKGSVRQQGFTLLETIVVLVVLGILSVGLFTIFNASIRQYLDASARTELTASARLAVERLNREMRNALPNSVRTSGDGNCVEFRPVVTGATYVELPTTIASTTLTAAPFATPAGSWDLSVMPLLTGDGVASDMYGPSPLTTAGIASISAPDADNVVTVTLTASKRFPRTSPGRRLFVIGTPVSFCITGTQLRRYAGYGNFLNQPAPASLGTGVLLADYLQTGDATNPVFRYSAGTLERNAMVQIDLLLQARDEQLRYAHEVLIRNVP